MKSLNAQEKKLFFRGLLILLAFIFIWSVYSIINIIKNHRLDKFIEKHEAMIELYEGKIDSINNVNKTLFLRIEKLDKEIDSLEKVKIIIYKEYDKKIDTIYNAGASNHAEWLESILYKLEDTYPSN